MLLLCNSNSNCWAAEHEVFDKIYCLAMSHSTLKPIGHLTVKSIIKGSIWKLNNLNLVCCQLLVPALKYLLHQFEMVARYILWCWDDLLVYILKYCVLRMTVKSRFTADLFWSVFTRRFTGQDLVLKSTAIHPLHPLTNVYSPTLKGTNWTYGCYALEKNSKVVKIYASSAM